MEHGKPIISTYWLDSTISLSQHKKNNVVAHTDQNKKEPTTTTVSTKTKDYVGDFGCKMMNKNLGPKTTCVLKDHPRYGDGEEEVIIKKVKKPMERYKKMQCWVILKRMLEGRDGWALKYPLDHKYSEGLSKTNRLVNKSKLKAIGLKDIETKLKLYSTPEEFADDMRFVFSQGLLYHPRHIVHRIAMKFSETFENKWKSLNEEWTLEERKVKRIHKRKRG
ncbi:transcription factor GTE12-like protein [Trifolium pratense]|uniref:Transcription factor GTE12-like protein n=1 Tax=Trifolium pratense TaxID=57577 RepID=A0A2K3MWL3_TRIPR|nr:transcription factor GTE12-like protein [Trifolium pratense]